MKTQPTKTKTFADYLREFRALSKLGQAEAAGCVMHLSKRTWQEWEHNTSKPPFWAQVLLLSELHRIWGFDLDLTALEAGQKEKCADKAIHRKRLHKLADGNMV